VARGRGAATCPLPQVTLCSLAALTIPEYVAVGLLIIGPAAGLRSCSPCPWGDCRLLTDLSTMWETSGAAAVVTGHTGSRSRNLGVGFCEGENPCRGKNDLFFNSNMYRHRRNRR